MRINFNPIIDNTLAYFPKRWANMAVGFYVLSLVACSLLYNSAIMPIYIICIGVISILLFFQGSYSLGRQWSRLSEKSFEKKILWTAFAIRLVHMVLIFFINQMQYGTYYESNAGDIPYYVPTAMRLSEMYQLNIFSSFADLQSWGVEIPDRGYMLYLQILFTFMGVDSHAVSVAENVTDAGISYVWFPLLLKSIYGALICVLMYRLAKRHFGENVARMTAIFCMLQWNMIWWCGSMMKETEMILISTVFIERMDRTISGHELSPRYIISTVAIGLCIFLFRSALFMVAMASTIMAIVMMRSRTLTIGKKIMAGVMIGAALLVAVGDNIRQEMVGLVDRAKNTEYVQRNMEWRTSRGGQGNQFAKYAGAAVFAPLIFTIPFPTMNYTMQSQEMQMQVNGGNYIKNVLSFFIIFAMFQLLLSGQWRQHVFPIAYYVGYLAALTLSIFAQSGRFHMPIMPFAMMFGAYGLTLVTSRKHKQWFLYALMLEVVFCVFWGWFKLKGRGLI